MPHGLAYSAALLDRAVTLRDNEQWLLDQAGSNPLVLAVWQDKNLVAHGISGGVSDPQAGILADDAARRVLGDPGVHTETIFLGLQEGTPIFAVDFSHMPEARALAAAGHGGEGEGMAQFTDLRTVGPLLDRHTGSMLAFARGMAYWHRRHRYCGVCGARTRSRSGGFVRSCTAETCNLEHFPRVDPAVIMLVTAGLPQGEHCLLGRQSGWAADHYSALAGFVEPGESLETAVVREVMEESAITVTDVQYQASQPWPFPSSLMLGFRARAVTFEIDVGDDELEDARWFSRHELRQRAQRDAADGKLSHPDSIARWLLESWLMN